MLRRILLAMCICFCLTLSLGSGVVRAQDATPTPTTGESPYDLQIYQREVDAYQQAVSDCSSPSLECLVRNTTRFVAIEWVAEIMGPNNPFTFKQDSADVGGGGAIAGLSNLIGGMYAYQPANTTRYVVDVMDHAGMAPPAYAQGLGFASLDPILSLWKTFRNVAYFFFIGVLIFIGIMIMLRQKISAQATVTAQQALPSIIISLILVTFSYAISGLLIDVMYVAMYLIVGIFNTFSPNGTVGTEAISYNIFQLAGMLFTQAVFDNFQNNTNLIQSVIIGLGAGNTTSNIVGFLGGLTLSIILAVAVLIGIVKLFFELLKSYASIIMGVVFAPVYLMLGAIPGKNAFSPWIKNMIGNLAAFPTVLLFVIIFQVFTSNISGLNQGGFMPPFLIGNGQSGIAGYIIGLAILLALPEIVKEVKKKAGAAEGGFGWMVGGAAMANAKHAWRRGGGAITGGLATATGAGTGALVGGTLSSIRGRSFKEGATTGALIGGAIPALTSQSPRMVRSLSSTVMNQGSQAAGKLMLGSGLERLRNLVPEKYARHIEGIYPGLSQQKEAATTSASNITQATAPDVEDRNESYS